MTDQPWYDLPIDPRAHKGGEEAFTGRQYAGGEFMPFYVPRPLMPQIDEADYPAFIAYCDLHRVAVDLTRVPPPSVRPHQRVDAVRAIQMEPKALRKPVLIGRDRYIIDGHHHWFDHMVRHDREMPVRRIALDFEPAIAFIFGFPGTYALGDGQIHPVKDA